MCGLDFFKFHLELCSTEDAALVFALKTSLFRIDRLCFDTADETVHVAQKSKRSAIKKLDLGRVRIPPEGDSRFANFSDFLFNVSL